MGQIKTLTEHIALSRFGLVTFVHYDNDSRMNSRSPSLDEAKAQVAESSFMMGVDAVITDMRY